MKFPIYKFESKDVFVLGPMGAPQQPGSNPQPNGQGPPQQQQQPPNSSQNPLGSPNPSHMSSPTPQSAHGHPFGQPNMMGQHFGSGANSPDKLMTEKIINDLSVGCLLYLFRWHDCLM